MSIIKSYDTRNDNNQPKRSMQSVDLWEQKADMTIVNQGNGGFCSETLGLSPRPVATARQLTW